MGEEPKVLRCECGLSILVVDEGDLVAEARRHALEAHGMEFTPEQLLALLHGPIDRRGGGR